MEFGAKRKTLGAKWGVCMMVDRIDVPGLGRGVSLQWVFPGVWHCWWDRCCRVARRMLMCGLKVESKLKVEVSVYVVKLCVSICLIVTKY